MYSDILRRSRTTGAPSEVENTPPMQTSTEKEVPKKVDVSSFSVHLMIELIYFLAAAH